VGFVPAVHSAINDLGLIESPQSTKSTQNLSIRYKTGTGNSRYEQSFNKPHSPCNAAIAGTRVARNAGSDDAATTTVKSSAGART
jgi:hypothetical protein